MHPSNPSNIHGDNNNKLKKAKAKANNKLFLCLRPVVMEDFLANSNGTASTAGPVFKFIHDMERNDGVLFPPVYSSAGIDGPHTPQKKKSQRKFMGVVKAALFETSLAKKIKKRTLMKKQKHSNVDPISQADKDLNLAKEKLHHQKISNKIMNGQSIVSGNVASKNSSSMCSSASSINNSKRFTERGVPLLGSSNPIAENGKIKQETVLEIGKGQYGSNTGLFLLLVTLLVLVLWGKVLAILCTSTWLFFIPNWNNISSKKVSKNCRVHYSKSMDMEEYKKKIIIEGFLDRNRANL